MAYKSIDGLLQGWSTDKNLRISKVIVDIRNIIKLEDDLKSNKIDVQQNNEDSYLIKIEKCYALIEKKIAIISSGEKKLLAEVIAESKFWTYVLYVRDSRHKAEILSANENNLFYALSDFWASYNRTFDDYITAIKMLSRLYKKEYWQDKEGGKERIENAFWANIRYCGDVGDLGYCYRGIMAISKELAGLNDELLMNIIKRYSINEVVAIEVYRHQIVAMIDCITGNYSLQKYLRNTILYGTLLTDILIRQLSLKNQYWESVYYDIWTNNKYTFSDYENKIMNNVYIDQNQWCISASRESFQIEVKDKENENFADKKICIRRLKPIEAGLEFPLYVETFEWRLNQLLNNRGIRNKIKIWLYNKGGDTFNFSYLYIKNFRNLSLQQMSFTHEYTFNPEISKIEVDVKEYFDTKGFYGKNIRSMSCIVGKNGAGKTSIIEFLGKYFPRIVAKYDQKINWPDIFIELKLQENMEFLAIFEYGEQHYYISNINNIITTENVINYYDVRGLLSGNGERSKVYFFSNKVDLRSISNLSQDAVENENIFSQMEYTRINDIREMFFMRNANISRINLMRCYIFSYIKYCLMKRKDDFNTLEWEGIHLANHLDEDEKGNWNTMLMGRTEGDKIRDFFYDTEAVCFNLSSGQEAKFIFLAELFWCMAGGERFLNEFGTYLKENREQIDVDRCIQKGETAILYIDEGDLYYHPEWQRQFVQSICEILQERTEKCQLQVVIATNSPYILSDFFKQDIVYILNEQVILPDTETFAQNIHTLLSEPFFMSSTLGSIAYEKIVGLINILGKKINYPDMQFEHDIKKLFKINKDDIDIRGYLNKFSECIGEDLYQIQIRRMLSEIYAENDIDNPEIIKNEIERLQKRLDEIEGKNV